MLFRITLSVSLITLLVSIQQIRASSYTSGPEVTSRHLNKTGLVERAVKTSSSNAPNGGPGLDEGQVGISSSTELAPTTGAEEPCGASFQITDVTSDSMRVTWSCEGCPNATRVEAVSHPTIEPCDESIDCEDSLGTNVTGCELDLSRLCPGRQYQVGLYGGDGAPMAKDAATTRPEKPNSPTNLTLVNVEAEVVLLHWMNPNCPRNPYLVNAIVYWKNNSQDDKETHLVKPPDAYFNPVLGLTSWTDYTFMLKSCLEGYDDLCSFSESLTTRTKMGTPEAPIVKMDSKTSEEIGISWNEPKLNGEFKVYRVDCGQGIVNTIGEENFTCANLRPYTSYPIRAAADNTEIQGPWSPEIELRTDVAKPSVPRNVTVQESTSNSVSLSWERPLEPNGPINGYLVGVKVFNPMDEEELNFSRTVETPGQVSELLITELLAWRIYNLSIGAFNLDSRGQRICGEIYESSFETEIGVPDLPRVNVTVPTDVTDKTAAILIPRALFSADRGPILNYAVLVGEKDTLDASQDSGETGDRDDLPNWWRAQETPQPYRASPSRWNPYGSITNSGNPFDCKDKNGGRECTIGIEPVEVCTNGTYCNGPLKHDTEYRVKIRGYTKAGWAESPVYYAKTGSSGGSDSSNYAGAIAGGVIGCLLLIGIVYLFCFRKWKTTAPSAPTSVAPANDGRKKSQAGPLNTSSTQGTSNDNSAFDISTERQPSIPLSNIKPPRLHPTQPQRPPPIHSPPPRPIVPLPTPKTTVPADEHLKQAESRVLSTVFQEAGSLNRGEEKNDIPRENRNLDKERSERNIKSTEPSSRSGRNAEPSDLEYVPTDDLFSLDATREAGNIGKPAN